MSTNEEKELQEKEILVKDTDRESQNPAAEEPANDPKKGDKKVHVMSQSEYDQALAKERFPLAIIAGIVVGVVCAFLWAGITLASGYQIGYMAIGVGAVVGFAIRKIGNGITQKFGIAGAVIALLACLLGNALIILGYVDGAAVGDLSSLMVETFDPIDILFYALAVGAGYRFSFKKVEIV